MAVWDQSRTPILTCFAVDCWQVKDQNKYLKQLAKVKSILKTLKETHRSLIELVGLEQLKELKLRMDEIAHLPSLRRLNSILMLVQ